MMLSSRFTLLSRLVAAWAALFILSGSLHAQILDKQKLLDQETFWDNRDWDWYQQSIPFFECPDREIQTTYYYRWELLTKHLTYGSPNSGFSFTEFIDRPFWSGAYGAISCPAGHQLYEARWLRDPRVARDYGKYWLRTPGAQPRNYSTWLADSLWAVHEVHSSEEYLLDLLPDLVRNYEAWEQRQFVPEVGLFWQTGHDDGMEFNINSRQTKDILRGAPSYRPSFNAYMWADALAIARIADLADEPAIEKRFRDKAEALKNNVQTKLWDPQRKFFFPMYRDDEEREGHRVRKGTLTYQSGQFAGDSHGRELIGYVPWQFGMLDPDQGFEVAWKKLMDRDAFWADRGPTTVERHDPLFLLQKSCCWWSGQSWPYATTQTLKGMARVLQDQPASPPVVANEVDVRSAVDRSLAFLSKEGATWISDRGCMSCHHVPFLVWTHRSAQQHGLKVDQTQLVEWETWCQKDSLDHRNQYRLQNYELGKLDKEVVPESVKEKLKPAIELPFPTEEAFVEKLGSLLTEEELKVHRASLLKAAERSHNHPDRTGGGLDVLASLMIGITNPDSVLASADFQSGTSAVMQENQLPDGSWMPGQQYRTMRRWSESTANQVTTMWAVLALADRKDKAQTTAAIQKALAYLRTQLADEDNREWLATKLLFERQLGSEAEVSRLTELLLKGRNSDGGWAWEAGGVSDAFTTGLAMYALAKLEGDFAVVLREARTWLLQAQAADGSWPTAARNFTKTKSESLTARDEIYHYWGTAWATLGLLETIGVVPDQEPAGAGLRPADYLEVLRTYALSHRKDGKPYLAEALHPDTGSFEGHDGYNHSEHYFHSGFCDLIITGLVGVVPSADQELRIQPLAPDEWDYFALDNLPYQGHSLTVLWDRTGKRYGRGPGLQVWANGKLVASSQKLEALEVELPDPPEAAEPSSTVRTNFAVNNDGWYFPRFTSSFANPQTPINKLHDGNFWYHEHPPNRWTCQGSPNPVDWVVVDFGIARTFDEIQLYFLDDDGKTPISAPRSVTLESWREDQWQPIAAKPALSAPTGHRANRYVLEPISTERVRVTFEHSGETRAGLSELEIWGNATLPLDPVLMPPGNLAFNNRKQEFPKASASHTSRYDKVASANDGVVHFGATPNNRWTSYESPDKTDWLEIDFGQPTRFSRIELALYDDRGGVQPPQSFEIEVWDGSSWKAIPDQKRSPEKPVGGQFNESRFPSLESTKVRFVFTHQGAARTGLTEVLVWPE